MLTGRAHKTSVIIIESKALAKCWPHSFFFFYFNVEWIVNSLPSLCLFMPKMLFTQAFNSKRSRHTGVQDFRNNFFPVVVVVVVVDVVVVFFFVWGGRISRNSKLSFWSWIVNKIDNILCGHTSNSIICSSIYVCACPWPQKLKELCFWWVFFHFLSFLFLWANTEKWFVTLTSAHFVHNSKE